MAVPGMLGRESLIGKFPTVLSCKHRYSERANPAIGFVAIKYKVKTGRLSLWCQYEYPCLAAPTSWVQLDECCRGVLIGIQLVNLLTWYLRPLRFKHWSQCVCKNIPGKGKCQKVNVYTHGYMRPGCSHSQLTCSLQV